MNPRPGLPWCTTCGEDYLTINARKIHDLQLFCANDKCPEFVKCFWVSKQDLGMS